MVPKGGGKVGAVVQLDEAQVEVASGRAGFCARQRLPRQSDHRGRQRPRQSDTSRHRRCPKQIDLDALGFGRRVGRSRRDHHGHRNAIIRHDWRDRGFAIVEPLRPQQRRSVSGLAPQGHLRLLPDVVRERRQLLVGDVRLQWRRKGGRRSPGFQGSRVGAKSAARPWNAGTLGPWNGFSAASCRPSAPSPD